MIFIACDKNRIYEENIKINDDLWDKNNKTSFNINIIDTITLHNLYINIRNSGDYQYSNVFLFIKTI